jgi:hypothetical protein
MPNDFTLETKGCGKRYNVEYTADGLCNILDEDSDTVLILNCDMLKDGNDSCDINKIDVIKQANDVWDDLYNQDYDDNWTFGDYISWGETMALINKKGKLVLYLVPLFDGKEDDEFSEFYEFVINFPKEHNLAITDCYKRISIFDLKRCHNSAEEDRNEAIQDLKNLQEDPDNGYSIYF